MPTPYEKMYSNLLPKFKSYDLPLMTEEEVKAYLNDYIIPATTNFYACKKDLSDRDEELEQFNADLTEMELDILCNFLVIAYVHANYIVTPTLLKVSVSSKDYNVFSNANHLDKLLALYNQMKIDNESKLMRYSWCDSEYVKNRLKAGFRKT